MALFGGCCFDYGNAESDAKNHFEGTMEALYWGSSPPWGQGAVGHGPWMMADLEYFFFFTNRMIRRV